VHRLADQSLTHVGSFAEAVCQASMQAFRWVITGLHLSSSMGQKASYAAADLHSSNQCNCQSVRHPAQLLWAQAADHAPPEIFD
jgi:hypothetical protein